MELDSRAAPADTTAPWPPVAPEESGSFRWLRPGELLAIPVPTSALQLDALLRHLEIDGEFGDWPAASIHLAQARSTWQRLEPAISGRVAGRAHLRRRAQGGARDGAGSRARGRRRARGARSRRREAGEAGDRAGRGHRARVRVARAREARVSPKRTRRAGDPCTLLCRSRMTRRPLMTRSPARRAAAFFTFALAFPVFVMGCPKKPAPVVDAGEPPPPAADLRGRAGPAGRRRGRRGRRRPGGRAEEVDGAGREPEPGPRSRRAAARCARRRRSSAPRPRPSS